jgi:hypothetical protein
MIRFHYNYETTLEEWVESSFAALDQDIDRAGKWRPSTPLLIIGGICGGIAVFLASTVSGKLIGLVLPIALAVLLTVSSKQSRLEGVRRRIHSRLSKNYKEKKCHSHDLTMDDSGLVEKCPCGTDTRHWEAIRSWHETERMIVMCAHNRTFYAIPKRIVPSEALQPLREYISRHVV